MSPRPRSPAYVAHQMSQLRSCEGIDAHHQDIRFRVIATVKHQPYSESPGSAARLIDLDRLGGRRVAPPRPAGVADERQEGCAAVPEISYCKDDGSIQAA